VACWVSSHGEFSPPRAETKNSQISERESVANNQLDKLNHGPEHFDMRTESFEGAARAALDSRAGRTLTDADWAMAKDRLLEFFHILLGWDRKARAVSRDLVMCEVPCLHEL
jgi:hypothetical protein